jgi:hypothetical protein
MCSQCRELCLGGFISVDKKLMKPYRVFTYLFVSERDYWCRRRVSNSRANVSQCALPPLS